LIVTVKDPSEFADTLTLLLFESAPGFGAGVGVAVGVAVGAGVGVAVGAGVGVAVGAGVGVAVGAGVGVAVGAGVGVAVGDGVGVAVGAGVGVTVGAGVGVTVGAGVGVSSGVPDVSDTLFSPESPAVSKSFSTSVASVISDPSTASDAFELSDGFVSLGSESLSSAGIAAAVPSPWGSGFTFGVFFSAFPRRLDTLLSFICLLTLSCSCVISSNSRFGIMITVKTKTANRIPIPMPLM
jgi:hypothetical protein